MRDYSKYEKTPVLFSGAEKKFEIIIDGFRYIVKFQKNSEVGLTFNYVSEYLGSHIFQLLGIPVQETFLGTYEGKNVVVMKNFLEPEDDLVALTVSAKARWKGTKSSISTLMKILPQCCARI